MLQFGSVDFWNNGFNQHVQKTIAKVTIKFWILNGVHDLVNGILEIFLANKGAQKTYNNKKILCQNKVMI